MSNRNKFTRYEDKKDAREKGRNQFSEHKKESKSESKKSRKNNFDSDYKSFQGRFAKKGKSERQKNKSKKNKNFYKLQGDKNENKKEYKYSKRESGHNKYHDKNKQYANAKIAGQKHENFDDDVIMSNLVFEDELPLADDTFDSQFTQRTESLIHEDQIANTKIKDSETRESPINETEKSDRRESHKQNSNINSAEAKIKAKEERLTKQNGEFSKVQKDRKENIIDELKRKNAELESKIWTSIMSIQELSSL